jgi:hypothetical protein
MRRNDQPPPEKEPAQQQTQPGYTYQNPNEDQRYQPLEDTRVDLGDADEEEDRR